MKIKTKFQLPLIMMILYLVFTLILYVIGPLDWVTYNPVYFWFLQILYIVMLFCGWQVGLTKIYTRTMVWDEKQEENIVSKLRIPLIINLVYEFVNIFRKFMFTSFDIRGLFDRIVMGFTNMGDSYNILVENVDSARGNMVVGGTVVTLFNFGWDFFAFAVLLLATLYFKRLSKLYQGILIVTYLFILSSYIGTGTNIGVFRLVLAWILFLFIKLIRGERSFDKKKWKKRKKWIICGTIVGIVFCTVLFDKIMQSRGGILLWDTSYYNIGGIGIKRDSILLRILPVSWQMLLVAATGYLTQGYYGMSLCQRVSWEPTFGLGHSMAIEKLLKRYITDWPYMRTYQHRIEQFGWAEDVQWHTAYSWIANDVSFLGTAVIIFIFGMLFAMAYRDAIKTNNPFAYLIVYFFSLEAFFLPCNNQIFQSTYVLFSFIMIMLLWLCTRGRKRIVFKIKRGI